jgi:3-isopropylmalate/(R)-2-methylmalate dehydratase small subunit
LKAPGFVVVARSFARIFLQNSINLGLKTVICPALEAEVGDELEIVGGRVINRTSGKEFNLVPLPRARQAIIDAGGLIPFTRQRILEKKREYGTR